VNLVYAYTDDILTCPKCGMFLYRFKETVFCGDRMRPSVVEGVHPVPDPEDKTRVTCFYCKVEINKFKRIKVSSEWIS